MVDLPSGFVGVEQKNITNVGTLEEFVDTIVKVITLDELLYQANTTRVLVFPSDSFNEPEVNRLDLSGLHNLEGIEIGEHSFTHVDHVVFDQMDNLTSLSIGKGSFSEDIANLSNMSSRCLRISECGMLRRLVVGERAFYSYDLLITRS